MLFRSIKGLQIDDWIMGLFVTAAYTVLVIFANRWLKVDSNIEPPGFDFGALSPKELSRRVYGSKLVVAVEQMHISVIWACKACLLIMYHRITRTALQYENIAIKILAGYTAMGFVIVEVLYFTTWCQPFSEYYTVPTSSLQCITLVHHRIAKAVFSVSSDLIMLSIALQMLIRSLLPVKRKIILCAIFSLGLFVVAASIANFYYSFSDPYQVTWIYWYVRESSTAILVANLPFTWTILREMFELGQFDETNPPPAWTYHSARTAGGRRQAQQLHSQTNSTYRTYSQSYASRTTRSMTFVTSNGVTSVQKSSQHEDVRIGLARQPIELDDFPPAVLRGAGRGIMQLDVEAGLIEDTNGRPVLLNPMQQRSKFVSTLPTITQAGNEKVYIDECRLSTPSVAHFTLSSKRTSANSVMSLVRRPASPVH